MMIKQLVWGSETPSEHGAGLLAAVGAVLPVGSRDGETSRSVSC